MPRLFSLIFLLLFGCVSFEANASDKSFPDSSDSAFVVKRIVVTGNKVTRLPVILRDLMFSEGDTIPSVLLTRLLKRSRENLMNTGIFNFVNITYVNDPSLGLTVLVDVTERWYVFPVPLFEMVDRNFNEWIRSGDPGRINYGLDLDWSNFRGLNDHLKFQFKWGYTHRLGIAYQIPFNNWKAEEKLTFSTGFTASRETGYGVDDSRLLLFKGDGGSVRKEYFFGLNYSKRSGYFNSFTLSMEYRNNRVSDTIVTMNPAFLGSGKNNQELLTLSWGFRRDMRDYKFYPLRGYLFDLDVVKNGTGLLVNEPDLIFFSAQLKYFKPFAAKFGLAGSVKGKLSGKSEAPYFNQRALGYNSDFIRGYEYYVIPGQNYALMKFNVKYTLMGNRIMMAPAWVPEKFRTLPNAVYLNAGFDWGYVRDRQFSANNPLANRHQYGYGIGLDYVTYYSLVFRLQYSINRWNERGLYLHFTAPI